MLVQICTLIPFYGQKTPVDALPVAIMLCSQRRFISSSMMNHGRSRSRFVSSRKLRNTPVDCRLRLGDHGCLSQRMMLSLPCGKDDGSADDTLSLAQNTVAALANKGRTWRRLRHVVDLACTDYKQAVKDGGDESMSCSRTVVDLGCDHGLLTVALAVSGAFDAVIGVDVSERALLDGAIALNQQLQNRLKAQDDTFGVIEAENILTSLCPVEFRAGNGLQPLGSGEAQTICIGGIGINTILKILADPINGSGQNTSVDRVGGRRLVLQPTNSRPRNLILLYDSLHELGWSLVDERIEFLSARWFVTSAFVRIADPAFLRKTPPLPGCRLARFGQDDTIYQSYKEYVFHHQRWLEHDLNRNATLDVRVEKWLRSVASFSDGRTEGQ